MGFAGEKGGSGLFDALADQLREPRHLERQLDSELAIGGVSVCGRFPLDPPLNINEELSKLRLFPHDNDLHRISRPSELLEEPYDY